MNLDNPEHRKIIQSNFPALTGDNQWKIASPVDGAYNCIAYAAIKTDIWWWPEDTDLDGVDWPFNLPRNTDLSTFQDLFRHGGYAVCTDALFEKGYQKIAIYTQTGDTSNCTHAARQKNNGIWVSKLGINWDIEHSTPYTIEGASYGKVACIMKRKFS